MLRPALVALAFLLPLPALAADARAPVVEIMAAAENNWLEMGSGEGEPPPYVDYFGEDFLKRLYSRDFVAKYREAAKYPAYDDGGSPFDYDPIVGGQDGCALKDVKIAEGAPADGVTSVTVTFDNTYCFGERAPDWKPETLIFKIVEEDGRAVIDDIERPDFEEDASMKKEMTDIAAYGAKGDTGEEGGTGESAE